MSLLVIACVLTVITDYVIFYSLFIVLATY